MKHLFPGSALAEFHKERHLVPLFHSWEVKHKETGDLVGITMGGDRFSSLLAKRTGIVVLNCGLLCSYRKSWNSLRLLPLFLFSGHYHLDDSPKRFFFFFLRIIFQKTQGLIEGLTISGAGKLASYLVLSLFFFKQSSEKSPML